MYCGLRYLADCRRLEAETAAIDNKKLQHSSQQKVLFPKSRLWLPLTELQRDRSSMASILKVLAKSVVAVSSFGRAIGLYGLGFWWSNMLMAVQG